MRAVSARPAKFAQRLSAMAGQGQVHFKFKSTKAFDSVSFSGHYLSVGELKALISEKKVPTSGPD